MSNDKKVTIYDKTTGKFLVAGNANSKKISDLIIAGNIRVEGMQDNDTKRDFVTSSVVPDTDKIQEEADYEAEIAAARIRRPEIHALLETNYGDRSKDAETIDTLNELARL
tara:strand:+ start:126 stop:458 length:333 start_codon:yes stop_codon:yes gene_type:complete